MIPRVLKVPGVDSGWTKLLVLIIELITNSVVEQQASTFAGDRAVIAIRRDPECSAIWGEEYQPVWVLKPIKIKFKEALALDDSVVVGLMLVDVPLLLPLSVQRRACGPSCMFDQVKAVRALYSEVGKMNCRRLPEGSFLGEEDVAVVEEVSHFDLLSKVIVDGCEVVYTLLVIIVEIDAGFPEVSKEWTRTSGWPLFSQVLIN